MPATNKPSPQAPKPAQRERDNERVTKQQDERLSEHAGYGKGTNAAPEGKADKA